MNISEPHYMTAEQVAEILREQFREVEVMSEHTIRVYDLAYGGDVQWENESKMYNMGTALKDSGWVYSEKGYLHND